MKIIVICNNGNSSSVLAQKMNKVAKELGKDYQIDAIPPFDAKKIIGDYDVVLIAPQIKFDLANYKKIHDKVVDLPPMVFGMLDGKKAIEIAEELYGK